MASDLLSWDTLSLLVIYCSDQSEWTAPLVASAGQKLIVPLYVTEYLSSSTGISLWGCSWALNKTRVFQQRQRCKMIFVTSPRNRCARTQFTFCPCFCVGGRGRWREGEGGRERAIAHMNVNEEPAFISSWAGWAGSPLISPRLPVIPPPHIISYSLSFLFTSTHSLSSPVLLFPRLTLSPPPPPPPPSSSWSHFPSPSVSSSPLRLIHRSTGSNSCLFIFPRHERGGRRREEKSGLLFSWCPVTMLCSHAYHRRRRCSTQFDADRDRQSVHQEFGLLTHLNKSSEKTHESLKHLLKYKKTSHFSNRRRSSNLAGIDTDILGSRLLTLICCPN